MRVTARPPVTPKPCEVETLDNSQASVLGMLPNKR